MVGLAYNEFLVVRRLAASQHIVAGAEEHIVVVGVAEVGIVVAVAGIALGSWEQIALLVYHL